MSNKSNAASGGTSFGGVLFIVFLVLKLCHVINWSWWWVTAPLWIPAIVVIPVFLFVLGVLVYREVVKGLK